MTEKNQVETKWKANGPSLVWTDSDRDVVASVKHRDDSNFGVESENEWHWFVGIERTYHKGSSATLDTAVKAAEQAIQNVFNSQSYQRDQERHRSTSNAIADFLREHKG